MHEVDDSAGSLRPILVARDADPALEDSMKLVVRSCRVCTVVAACAGAAMYVLLCVFVVLNPELNPHLAVKLAVVTLFPLLIAVFLLGALADDPMVLAANERGIYYPVRANRNVLVWVRWNAIREMKMYDDGSRQLEVKTSFGRQVALPRPCGGETDYADGAWSLVFTPGLRMKTADIMRQLHGLRHAGASAIGQR